VTQSEGGAHSMRDDVGPANKLAFRLRQHLADQGLDVTVQVELREGWQPFIDVTFPNGDGFGTWGSPTPESVCVIDPSDRDMTHSEFLEYGTLRARGYSANEASEHLWPGRRWFKRRALP